MSRVFWKTSAAKRTGRGSLVACNLDFNVLYVQFQRSVGSLLLPGLCHHRVLAVSHYQSLLRDQVEAHYPRDIIFDGTAVPTPHAHEGLIAS